MRIFLLGNGERPGVREQAEQLRPLLREHCEIVVDDLDQKEDLSQYRADIALVLGGTARFSVRPAKWATGRRPF